MNVLKVEKLFSFGLCFGLLFVGLGNGFSFTELEENIDYLHQGRIISEIIVEDVEEEWVRGNFLNKNLKLSISDNWQGFLNPVTEKEDYMAKRREKAEEGDCYDYDPEVLRSFNLRRIEDEEIEGEEVTAHFRYDNEANHFFIHRIVLKR